MSLHSYTKCWLHLIWGTLNREKSLSTIEVRDALSSYLINYSKQNDIYLKIFHVNTEHVHTLIDLPTNMTIENILKLLKGSSSHWINENNLIRPKFAWGRGYAAFSISESHIERVVEYIKNQDEHHRKKSFAEEYQKFIEVYGMKYFRED